jgi:uracil-DNA glycosylase family 4
MRWTERQRAMLDAMGVRLFERPAPEGASVPAPALPAKSPAPMAAPVAPRAIESPAVEARAVATDAGRAAIASLDWPALRAAVAACRACRLCETRTQTVFGVGSTQAHWMIVGEAPGEQEDAQGEPFVGAAGQLLDQMLRALGLTRGEAPPEQSVYIANTLKCRPPRNRNPDPAETARCAPFLERQIALVAPRIILAMGRFAAQSLLATEEPVGRLRGRIHSWRGVPLVVTYHPAYLLRTPTDKARAWEDLCLAASALSGCER